MQGLIPDIARDFLFSTGIEIGSRVQPVSYWMSNNGSLPEDNWLGHEGDDSPQSSGNTSAPTRCLSDMHSNNFYFYLGFIMSVFVLLNPNLSDISKPNSHQAGGEG
jgi:hypothetical protein